MSDLKLCTYHNIFAPNQNRTIQVLDGLKTKTKEYPAEIKGGGRITLTHLFESIAGPALGVGKLTIALEKAWISSGVCQVPLQSQCIHRLGGNMTDILHVYA